jgi:hypothetical protein
MSTVDCINMEDLNSIISYQFKDRDLNQYSINVLSDDCNNIFSFYLFLLIYNFRPKFISIVFIRS